MAAVITDVLGLGRPPCMALPCTLVTNDSLGQQSHSVLCRTRTSWQIIKLMFLMWKIAVTCPVVLPSLRFGTENGGLGWVRAKLSSSVLRG